MKTGGIRMMGLVLRTQSDICDLVKELTLKDVNLVLQEENADEEGMIDFYLTLINPTIQECEGAYELLKNVRRFGYQRYEPEHARRIISAGEKITGRPCGVKENVLDYASDLVDSVTEEPTNKRLSLEDSALILAGSIESIKNIEFAGGDVEGIGNHEFTRDQKTGLYKIFPKGFYLAGKLEREER